MKVLPVIARELRAQARQPVTYWLRTLSVAALLLGGWLIVNSQSFTPNSGGTLFSQLHFLTYCTLWILVPLSAADCISRERRDGTLGLLFLTPLQPPHIVIAKGLVHGLRAAMLVVAIVPVLMIPFLLGGVSWQQAALAVLMYGNAICWCLAAALVASAVARLHHQALALSALATVGGFVVFPWVVGALLGLNSQMTWTAGYSQSTYDFFAGFALVASPGNSLRFVARIFNNPQFLFAMGMASVISVAALVLAVVFAGNRIRRAWRDEPPSRRAEQIQRTFFRPVLWRGFLQRWMTRLLERNPIGWLERRQWSGRMVTWAWFAVIISVYSVAVTDRHFLQNSDGIQRVVGWLLAFSMAVTAAGSFWRERETGVLELLLVSPMTTRQIIWGRLRGIWGQFLPAALAYVALRIFFFGLDVRLARNHSPFLEIWCFWISFFAIPVIGLYFSVVFRQFMGALAGTLLFVLVLPLLFVVLLAMLADAYEVALGNLGKLEWLVQIVAAGFFLERLHRKLEQRAFSWHRPVG